MANKIHAGAQKPGDYAPTQASKALMEALETSGPLTIVALGPLTNIASVLMHRPDLSARIDNLVIVGGRRREKHWKSRISLKYIPDANIAHDLTASQYVLAQLPKVTVVPFELARQIFFNKNDLARLGEVSEPLLRLTQQIKPWLHLWSVAGEKGFNPFDLFAVGYVTHPEAFQCFGVLNYQFQTIQLGSKMRPILEMIGLEPNKETQIQYCTDIDPAFKSLFFENLEISTLR